MSYSTNFKLNKCWEIANVDFEEFANTGNFSFMFKNAQEAFGIPFGGMEKRWGST